jgi:N-acetyl-alpha-D-muramate 1-phosphate uridylyltransferase
MTTQHLPCLLLAAGRGERMRPLSDHTPKPLLKIKGKSLLSWHLESLQRAGIQNVVINHAWLGEQIETTLGNGHDFGLSIQYSPEKTALETAGGICQALPILNLADFFLVINGDIFCPDFPISELIKRSELLRAQEQFLAHLILVPNPPHHPMGDFYLDGTLVRGEENPKINLPKLTFSGIGIYHRRLFDGLIRGESAKLAPILRRAMLNNQISGEKYLGSWHDVGSPERLAELNRS